jgi:hypothetical protein
MRSNRFEANTAGVGVGTVAGGDIGSTEAQQRLQPQQPLQQQRQSVAQCKTATFGA